MAYRHLKKFKIDPILYMTEWFMCIFSRTLPWSCVLRVWDMFFCEGKAARLQVPQQLLLLMLMMRMTVVVAALFCRCKDHLPGGPGAPQADAGLGGKAAGGAGNVRNHGASEEHLPRQHQGGAAGAGGGSLEGLQALARTQADLFTSEPYLTFPGF